MKKFTTLVSVIAVILLVIVWVYMGIKLYQGNYDIIAEAYITGACIFVVFVCAICNLSGGKCPYCNKPIYQKEKYCPHCGREI